MFDIRDKPSSKLVRIYPRLAETTIHQLAIHATPSRNEKEILA